MHGALVTGEREPSPAPATSYSYAWLFLLLAIPLALWWALRPSDTPVALPPTPSAVDPLSPDAARSLVVAPGHAPEPGPAVAPSGAAFAAQPAVALAQIDGGVDAPGPAAPVRFEGEVFALVSVAQDLRHPGTQRASDAVNAQLEALRSCYRDALGRGVPLSGSLSARIHIEPAGAASEVLVRGTLSGSRADGGTQAADGLRDCVERVLRTVHVPGLASMPRPSGAPPPPDAGALASGTDLFAQLLFTRRVVTP